MLRSFRLANHRSIAEEQKLLLMPAFSGDDRAVVPVTAIYGANASGKSNLLDGLRFMQSAVMLSFAQWDAEGSISRRPFRLRPGSRSEASFYVIELIAEGVPYTYGFALDDDEIIEEWLYSFPEKRKRVIFQRKRGDIKFGTTVSGELRSKLEFLEEITRPNALFLSVCAQAGIAELMPVQRWFHWQLQLQPLCPRQSRDLTADQLMRLSIRQPEMLHTLKKLVIAADIGISDLLIEETGNSRWSDVEGKVEAALAAAAYLGGKPQYELKFVHGIGNEPFSLADESAGTRSWLALLPMVLEALDGGYVVVVDEIDTSLHPLLTAQLIGLFHDPETNKSGAQLIFTTHDSSLLGTMIGDQVLARDEIWFVEKDKHGASSLFPVSDFKPRKEQNLERRYLGGSYGAVPVFDSSDFADAVLGR